MKSKCLKVCCHRIFVSVFYDPIFDIYNFLKKKLYSFSLSEFFEFSRTNKHQKKCKAGLSFSIPMHIKNAFEQTNTRRKEKITSSDWIGGH